MHTQYNLENFCFVNKNNLLEGGKCKDDKWHLIFFVWIFVKNVSLTKGMYWVPQSHYSLLVMFYHFRSVPP